MTPREWKLCLCWTAVGLLGVSAFQGLVAFARACFIFALIVLASLLLRWRFAKPKEDK